MSISTRTVSHRYLTVGVMHRAYANSAIVLGALGPIHFRFAGIELDWFCNTDFWQLILQLDVVHANLDCIRSTGRVRLITFSPWAVLPALLPPRASVQRFFPLA